MCTYVRNMHNLLKYFFVFEKIYFNLNFPRDLTPCTHTHIDTHTCKIIIIDKRLSLDFHTKCVSLAFLLFYFFFLFLLNNINLFCMCVKKGEINLVFCFCINHPIKHIYTIIKISRNTCMCLCM